MVELSQVADKFLDDVAKNAAKVNSYLSDAYDVLTSDLHDGIAQTPYEIVHQEDRVKLKYYKSNSGKKKRNTPLLVVYALINRETMLDLQPGRSVVEKFLNDGMDVYMIEWGYPSFKDKYLTIDDHVNGYLDNMVDFVREKENSQKVNLMGICMGGTFCTMYSSLHPEKVKNLVLTVTPTNFETNEGLLHVWMKKIDVDKVVDGFGNLPGDIMNFGFLLLNPARLMIDKYKGFLNNMDNKPFLENFIRMERWIYDSPDFPGETFRQFIKDLYQKNLLIKNELVIGGNKVDLKKITMPVLNIYAKFDHLVPPSAADKFTSVIGSKDKEDLCLETGHIGIYVSSKYQNEFAPKISSWLLERDSEDKKNGSEKQGKKTASEAA
ncbi:MAG: class III poly(R)-hydroxyalkanoic acid synthase subunit PhaC [Desulfobacteraceae bacterium]|nr:class III poly(R)-hydroxyalkanoic acid synthase subunit PhaC [Desulfobacteraceae bacterium]